MDPVARKLIKPFFVQRVNTAFQRFSEINGTIPAEVNTHAVEILLSFLDTPHSLTPFSASTHNPIRTIDEFIEDAERDLSSDYEWRRRKYLGDLIVFTLGFMCRKVPSIPLFRGKSRDYLFDVASENYNTLSHFSCGGHEDDQKFFLVISQYTEVCAIGLQSVKESMPYPKPCSVN